MKSIIGIGTIDIRREKVGAMTTNDAAKEPDAMEMWRRMYALFFAGKALFIFRRKVW